MSAAVGRQIREGRVAGLPGVLREGGLLTGHAGQVEEEVPTVDVQALGHRTEAVRGIETPVALEIVRDPPAALIDLLARLRLHVVDEGVDVGAFGVGQLAEHTLARHVQGLQLEEVVAAVLQHHAVLGGAFTGLHQLPAAVDVQGRRHLDRSVLAVLHGADRHRHVPAPRRRDVDEVEVQLAEVAPVLGAGGELPGRGTAVLLEDLLRTLHALGPDVAEGGDVDILHLRQALDRPRAAHAEADDAHPHALEGRRREAAHVADRGPLLLGAADEAPGAERSRGRGQGPDEIAACHLRAHDGSIECGGAQSDQRERATLSGASRARRWARRDRRDSRYRAA